MMRGRLDFRLIAARALDRIEAVCAHWLPAGKRSGHEWEIGDRHGAAGRSLKIHLSGTKAGQWADFATGDKGGDLVSLVAFVDACPQADAARRLAEFLGVAPTSEADTPAPAPAQPAQAKPAAPAWRAIMPVPENAPPAPAAHPKHGAPDKRYVYRGPAGELLGFVARFEASATRPKKEFAWQVYAEAGERREWRWQGFPAPRPLYGLEHLAERPAETVVLTEGEKAAEACRELMPDHLALTWPGGGKAADKADFTPLNDRHVILWADADQPGREAMKTAAKLVRQAGAASVRWLSLPALAQARGQGDLPAGFDAADLLGEGWDAVRMAVFLDSPGAMLAAVQSPPPGKPPADHAQAGEADPTADGEAKPFTLTADGLYAHKTNRDGSFRLVRLCDPLSVPALARDEENSGWAPLVEFRDRDGRQRQEIIPFRLFLGDGAEGLKLLADCGLAIEPGRDALDGLKQFIAGARPEKRARLVDATGWQGDAFMFPEGPLGDPPETLVFRGSKRAFGLFTPRGTLRQWQEHIGALAEGNPRLLFTLSVALSGALLKPCGGTSTVFHWWGDSSLGKSGALHAAGSVWGAPSGTVNSWRSTDNSIEGLADESNDKCLNLDELRESEARQFTAVTYMLGNQRGKNRAHRDGGLREATTWRVSVLSSGEIGLADHLASVGQKTHAGQAVRFLDLPADAGGGLGMWNQLHHLPSGGAFTDALKAAAAKYHGTAGRAFIEALIRHLADMPARARAAERDFLEVHVPRDAGGQVRRVAAAFALVGLAGELAAEWRVAPWPPRDSFDAAGLLFGEWLAQRPTAGNLEEAQILQHVRSVMERGWQAKFLDWARITEEKSDLSRMGALLEPYGFRKDTAKRAAQSDDDDARYAKEPGEADFHYYVTRSRFQEEFAVKAGFKPRRVAAVLRAHGILKCDSDSSTLSERLPNGDPRSYCIIGRKLWEATR